MRCGARIVGMEGAERENANGEEGNGGAIGGRAYRESECVIVISFLSHLAR